MYRFFTEFALDPDLVEKTGSEAGAFNETMKEIFGWKTRTTDDGVLRFTERGDAVCAMAGVFDEAMTKYRGDAVVEKWLSDIVVGLQKTYEDAGTPVSNSG